MRSFAGRHATFAVAVMALVLGAGGGALAAGGDRTISVCVKKHGGALYRASGCARGDGRLSWNDPGPAGAAGAAGSAGPAGPAGRDGSNGTNGTDGTNGTNGTDGVGATAIDFSASAASNQADGVVALGTMVLSEQCLLDGGTGDVTLILNLGGATWQAQGIDVFSTSVSQINLSSLTTAETQLLTVKASGPSTNPMHSADVTVQSAGRLWQLQLNYRANSVADTCSGDGMLIPST